MIVSLDEILVSDSFSHFQWENRDKCVCVCVWGGVRCYGLQQNENSIIRTVVFSWIAGQKYILRQKDQRYDQYKWQCGVILIVGHMKCFLCAIPVQVMIETTSFSPPTWHIMTYP